jgi:hypothetical protein
MDWSIFDVLLGCRATGLTSEKYRQCRRQLCKPLTKGQTSVFLGAASSRRG